MLAMVFARLETATIIASVMFKITVYNFYNNVTRITLLSTVAETPELDRNW